MAAADTPVLLLNAPLVANRLGYPDLSGLDLLELFAFINNEMLSAGCDAVKIQIGSGARSGITNCKPSSKAFEIDDVIFCPELSDGV